MQLMRNSKGTLHKAGKDAHGKKHQNRTGHTQGNREDLNKAEVKKKQNAEKAAELEVGTKNIALCKRHKDNGSIFLFWSSFYGINGYDLLPAIPSAPRVFLS